MIDEIVMTVVTPMTMPRIVRPERSLFVLSVSKAIFTDSPACPCAIRCSSWMPLQLSSQCNHRVKLGRLARRINAKENPRRPGDKQSQQHAPHLHVGWKADDQSNQLGNHDSCEDANGATKECHRRAFNQKLHQHIALACAQRLAHSNLARPF